jgi:DNA mismatch endonuclease (patch repair protein)
MSPRKEKDWDDLNKSACSYTTNPPLGIWSDSVPFVDTISRAARSENMRRIRSKGMDPELRVRQLLFRLGYRFRLHRKTLPGHPDIIFPSRRLVIFVHGCFWHQHKSSSCRITRLPKSNLDYWIPKLKRNVQRDALNRRALRKLDWRCLTVWECQVRDTAKLARKLRRLIGN